MAHRNTQAILRDPVAGMQVDTSIQPPVAAGQLGPTGLDEEKLQGILASMSPEEQEQFLQRLYGNYNAEKEILNDQMSQAGALRDQAGPQGRQTGRVYNAANPLEHLAGFGNYVAGERGMATAQDKLRSMGDEQAGARRTAGEYLMRDRAHGTPSISPMGGRRGGGI